MAPAVERLLTALWSSPQQQEAAAVATAPSGAPPELALHPRVRASLPGGVETAGPTQLRAALDAYLFLVAAGGGGVALEFSDTVVSPDGGKVGRAAGWCGLRPLHHYLRLRVG